MGYKEFEFGYKLGKLDKNMKTLTMPYKEFEKAIAQAKLEAYRNAEEIITFETYSLKKIRVIIKKLQSEVRDELL